MAVSSSRLPSITAQVLSSALPNAPSRSRAAGSDRSEEAYGSRQRIQRAGESGRRFLLNGNAEGPCLRRRALFRGKPSGEASKPSRRRTWPPWASGPSSAAGTTCWRRRRKRAEPGGASAGGKREQSLRLALARSGRFMSSQRKRPMSPVWRSASQKPWNTGIFEENGLPRQCAHCLAMTDFWALSAL